MTLTSLKDALDAFQAAVEDAPKVLRTISEVQAEVPRGPGKWSRKEILGHLVDSATNNHGRFVRMQLAEGLDLARYEQDDWVAAQQYQARPWHALIELWDALNRHLLHVVRQVRVETLEHTSRVAGDRMTLEAVITDYVRHLNHHLAQIAEPD